MSTLSPAARAKEREEQPAAVSLMNRQTLMIMMTQRHRRISERSKSKRRKRRKGSDFRLPVAVGILF